MANQMNYFSNSNTMNWLEIKENESNISKSSSSFISWVLFKSNKAKSNIFDITESITKLTNDDLLKILGLVAKSDVQISKEQQLEEMRNEIWKIDRLQSGIQILTIMLSSLKVSTLIKFFPILFLIDWPSFI